ncbi:unnamed protein product, partial [Mesorhabditis spiculigera]
MRIRPDITKHTVAASKEVALSLSGCGFLGTYHIGAAVCLFRHGKMLMSKVKRIGGASAGSLVAALLVLHPERLHKGLATFYQMAIELHSLPMGALTPKYVLQDRLLQIVDDHIPNDISPAQNRLMVSLTSYEGKQNKLISKFHDRTHLIETLLASCYIPGYSNADIAPIDPAPWIYPMTFDFGKHLILANARNLVRGKHALFPPPLDQLRSYYKQGFTDAHTFLKVNKLTDVQLTDELLEDGYMPEELKHLD